MDKKILYIDLKKLIVDRGEKMVGDIRSGISDASGNLSKSVKSNDISTEGVIGFEIEALDYFKYVEVGRKAGGKFPPLNKIKEWCKIKGIEVKYAFPIARKISIEGIKAKAMLQNAITKNENDIVNEVDQVVGEGLLKMANNFIDSLFNRK